ncbi:hypothetical protein B0H16DRAFT_1897687 [Mycena metata]|uniref:Uncharacterized protein n=1 Tax=Mycena metata TaxID=1033252 RepID=A0AAD7MID5_9AGAR|nr:hypothetical protein B0H16DRAFT_1897687 [Mycena metata]
MYLRNTLRWPIFVAFESRTPYCQSSLAPPGVANPPALPPSLDNLPTDTYVKAALTYIDAYPFQRTFIMFDPQKKTNSKTLTPNGPPPRGIAKRLSLGAPLASSFPPALGIRVRSGIDTFEKKVSAPRKCWAVAASALGTSSAVRTFNDYAPADANTFDHSRLFGTRNRIPLLAQRTFHASYRMPPIRRLDPAPALRCSWK